MIDALLAKIFGTQNERDVKAMLPTVAAINALEPQMRELSDIDLAAKTIEFKERLAQGATLDDLLIEAFAVAVCLHRDLDASQNETLLRDVTVRVAPTRRMSIDRIAVTSSKSRQLSVNFGEVLAETFVIFWTI